MIRPLFAPPCRQVLHAQITRVCSRVNPRVGGGSGTATGCGGAGGRCAAGRGSCATGAAAANCGGGATDTTGDGGVTCGGGGGGASSICRCSGVKSGAGPKSSRLPSGASPAGAARCADGRGRTGRRSRDVTRSGGGDAACGASPAPNPGGALMRGACRCIFRFALSMTFCSRCSVAPESYCRMSAHFFISGRSSHLIRNSVYAARRRTRSSTRSPACNGGHLDASSVRSRTIPSLHLNSCAPCSIALRSTTANVAAHRTSSSRRQIYACRSPIHASHEHGTTQWRVSANTVTRSSTSPVRRRRLPPAPSSRGAAAAIARARVHCRVRVPTYTSTRAWLHRMYR